VLAVRRCVRETPRVGAGPDDQVGRDRQVAEVACADLEPRYARCRDTIEIPTLRQLEDVGAPRRQIQIQTAAL
jgi:hypothetical protein